MTEEKIKREFENRNLKYQNKQLLNKNTLLNKQLKDLKEQFEIKVKKEVEKNLESDQHKVKIIKVKTKDNTRGLYKDYEQLQDKYSKKSKVLKEMTLRAVLAEDAQRRLEKIVEKKETLVSELEKENKEKDNQIKELQREIERLKTIQNNDGITAGIPTSMTPIGKKKIIPNFAKNTGEKIGRKEGHKKDKLETVSEDKINNHIEHKIKTCPYCNNHNLVPTGNVIKKQVKDYKIIVDYTEHDFIECKCEKCGKIVHESIPNHLKEECQYGSTIKSLVLTLTNVGNVAYNKQRRILSGLSIDEINPSEGYLAKLQKVSSKKLEAFIEELRCHILKSKIVYWDDTVISINKKQSCMRYYGNEEVSLFKAHEKKNKEGLDRDNILNLLSSNTIVEHDHNKVNYNPEYGFINAECCQHLLRDLKKVEINIPNRTWCKEGIKLFQEFDHKRNELISECIDTFANDEINEFILKLDEILLKGLEENENDSTPYYASKEKTLIYRIIEYRDNYIYWILDFDIPFTNNLSERNLRGVKSKMKVSGQFQNIDRAVDYANIRSYIETCRLYGVNEYICLSRLVEDNPYSLKELQSQKNK